MRHGIQSDGNTKEMMINENDCKVASNDLVELTLRGSRLESGGSEVDISDIDELTAFETETGNWEVRATVCLETEEPIGTTPFNGALEKSLCWVNGWVSNLVNEGGFLGKCLIFVMTISAITSGGILAIRISRDSTPLSPSDIKAPIMEIICSTRLGALTATGTFWGTPLT